MYRRSRSAWQLRQPLLDLEHMGYDCIPITILRQHRAKISIGIRSVHATPSPGSTYRNYGAYHAVVIADCRSRPTRKVAARVGCGLHLVFEGHLTGEENPEVAASQMLLSRLSEALPIPVLQEWAETLWEAGNEQGLIAGLTTGGDSPAGFWVQLTGDKQGSTWSKIGRRSIPLNPNRAASISSPMLTVGEETLLFFGVDRLEHHTSWSRDILVRWLVHQMSQTNADFSK